MADNNNKSATIPPLPTPTTNLHLPPPPNTSYHPHSPPPPPNSSTDYPAEATRRASCVIEYWLFALFFIIIALKIFFTIRLLVLYPDFPDFRVDSLSLSNFNLSTTTASTSLLSANFDVGITARNPNKKITLTYTHIEAEIHLGNDQISGTTLQPVFQSGKNETSFKAEFASVKAYVEGQAAKNGNLVLDLSILVKLKASGWGAIEVKSACRDLSVKVSLNSTNGTLLGGPIQCEVYEAY
ncbi:hypothetical protein ACH5RR_015359 [Cinchona calisaya]|uniref:Late embryogenesis abundant protein LEA-2 subgroup domain-containing protein n=1 Tax=Cinchona calisaya TaxID=153742 RepID=A0ABD2ZWE9_9GENT